TARSSRRSSITPTTAATQATQSAATGSIHFGVDLEVRAAPITATTARAAPVADSQPSARKASLGNLSAIRRFATASNARTTADALAIPTPTAEPCPAWCV